MRLFIASPVMFENYAQIKEDFGEILQGKWVEEENLHLTWIFLGNMSDEKAVIEKMKRLTLPETEVTISELGYFGRPPRILFARAREKPLYETAKTFKESGFDLYRFKPHITLCRIKQIDNYKQYKEKMKNYREKVLGTILPKITLYKSELSERGPEYTALYTLGE
ncbi:RNA 2',3'-cyclic phosphodiesterase [Sulfurovum riftiae]|uniref:RNA 2',3'-cyclic phosphodiesterase n=1 Tax=Sulfurovum riftiae TaxID=1630136 RepID=A0A151CHY1_9BACT|nr:RNA 2',3'-cyclic phosphodiesterase [Sulfurovum riftiae]KYJ86863.1 2'-5' RNA ligase [Sulfurovum riftiae]